MERERRLRRAQVLLAQGLLDKAIEEHARVVQEAPDDWPTLAALGNLYLRARRVGPAVEVFTRFAARLRPTAPPPQVLALCTRILRLAPETADVRLWAAEAMRAVAATEEQAGRRVEAMKLLAGALEYDPSDADSRLRMLRAAIERGEPEAARTWLPPELDTTDLILCALEVELLDGQADAARAAAERALAAQAGLRDEVLRLACHHAGRSAAAAFECVEASVQAAAEKADWTAAAAALREFASLSPNHVPALLRLVEVCVDGDLEEDLVRAQCDLAEAYLANDCANEARIISEDLAVREPWNDAYVDLYKRTLVMLGEPDPDFVVAETLRDSPSAALWQESEPAEPAPAPARPAEPPAAPARPAAKPDRQAKTTASAPAAPERTAAKATPPPAAAERTAAKTASAPAATERTATKSAAPPASGERPAAKATQPPAAAKATPPPAAADASPARQSGHATGELDDLATSQPARHAIELHRQGHTEEAVTLLRQALRSPARRFECAVLLARVHEEAAELPEAIEWFERASSAASSPQAEHAVLYDLGRALLAAGERDRALAVFMGLHSESPDYRDVEWRIATLGRGRKQEDSDADLEEAPAEAPLKRVKAKK
jgi:tetratricopeptide (TPR) repeat protein